ncbi:hypothetical protein A3H80_03075 [Candidatus Roizmanbacteria bacterium RIFCSPLOWO2_02_FULL_37_19]|uniref:Addiction module toxin RelE n=1 Tax=Candidatus Roizmanbacteria bacterium RIFCSPHIGHO2_02_FULL_37_24 TaxID=1802037 RepID=A0A1F7GZS6_9BACT|nr:MAG: hypothetical protein A3C24_02975 [Candidatus Roizmanbacteria bacterium RIFCSPHIGHO2_02_FULL_37_24]OGK32360.1 MAG: hypothetical protein A3E10_04215 [Candidatus Roizmanbacteria bacterium RIFCSPHIGHO2_12_FULL_37_23]OGK44692.1 MAG: hypothetical protein A2956_01005 [Candidatus Roizmanbacteria bacterium RIFCSPLOWO2_01_FULL_37_57]OGK53750.1 MAG: hypothetical protein A3H80_03075 [Candidatus Roizmanbacteria bacterium RIFCSPLOWO2_02_FULL_37_19]OGK61396.1 MAG: hypothetical protein A3G65_01620 [Can
MRITVSSRAEKELKKIHKIDQIAIVKKVRSLTVQLHKEKLTGYKDIFRVRAGQYRIVYRERKDEIYIILIGHHKDIYLLLTQLFK